jgi:peptidoglycan-associated lipoprotein
MPRLSRFALLFVSLPLVFGACKKKPPVVAATPPAPMQPAPPPAPRNEPPVEVIVVAKPSMSAAEVRRLILETVYFEYDSDNIRSDAQAALEQKIPLLNANPQVKLTIAGNCDERGSDEYNIALGRRRAEAVKRFLTDRGVDAGRVETISFGRERPAVQGSTEEAYAKNRRDEFTITAGGDNLKAP